MNNTIYVFLKRNLEEILFFSYGFGFAITYGHAFKSFYGDFSAIGTNNGIGPGADAAFAALFGSLVWPLYLSVQLWK